jgi:hypothetical protein
MTAAVPESSWTEMKETMLEASSIRTNWLDNAGQTFATAGTSITCWNTCRDVSASE